MLLYASDKLQQGYILSCASISLLQAIMLLYAYHILQPCNRSSSANISLPQAILCCMLIANHMLLYVYHIM